MARLRKSSGTSAKTSQFAEGAVASQQLQQSFPVLSLPVRPPFPPMEARSVSEIPYDNQQYEPKWDGFRCLAFRDGDTIVLQSKSGQPLGRYFPEIAAALLSLPAPKFVLDGEIVIEHSGRLSFDDLLMRIHPAESRIRRLSQETPATLLLFDLLVSPDEESLTALPLRDRRVALEHFFSKHVGHNSHIKLSPATTDRATAVRWITELAGAGFDGVVAKNLDVPYASGERTAMRKIKRLRTADCVIGGFRWASRGGEVGSLLLGLYDSDGLLHHIGFTSGFAKDQRQQLKQILKPYMEGEGFTGRAPGGPSRWSTERSGQWEHLAPHLVCEVQYDHFPATVSGTARAFFAGGPTKIPGSVRSSRYEYLPPRSPT